MNINDFYDTLVATNDKFERKGKNMRYTSANGYMFSMLNKDGELGIRLPKATGNEFMQAHQTTGYKSHGATMKDYVLIPDSMYNNMELLAALLEEAYQHVMSLPPK